MKIECPSCHLSGKVNELELPPEGRELKCPRCKAPFHVAAPLPPSGGQELMNMCPSCQYSTFTDEMFAVCPRCGLVAGDFREKVRKGQEAEQLRHDQELLTRSHRNPHLVAPVPDETIAEKAKAPQPVLIAAWGCMGVAGVLILYGVNGLLNYYSQDWQAVLSEQLLEPVSELSVFFRLGFMPWLITIFSAYVIFTAVQFLRLQPGSLLRMHECAWGGLGLGVIHEVVDFIKWVEISSSNPSFFYFLSGVLSSLFWILLWSVPSVALIWHLRSDRVSQEFAE
ncbi:MAG TPA: zinc-ribbon domain-containing protein [Geobacteraceae bacterium]|nr:zinc-ribbon domain-containing protein [Geobacteraceae bacterium]